MNVALASKVVIIVDGMSEMRTQCIRNGQPFIKLANMQSLVMMHPGPRLDRITRWLFRRANVSRNT